jgi:multiple sugar transport system substrate-binding protein
MIRIRQRCALRAAMVLLVAAVALAACSSSSNVQTGSAKGNITIWAHIGQDSENSALQAAIAGFNSSQSDITATLKLVPADAYTKTITATATSQLPDVMEMDGPTVANFVYNKKLTPISSYVSKQTIDNATDGIKAEGTVSGKLYALGMYDSGLGMYGNKKLLNAAGVSYPSGLSDAWTSQQFLDVLKKLAAASPNHVAIDIGESALNGEWGTYAFAPIVWSAGGQLINNGKAEGVLDTSKVAAALKQFQAWKPYVDPNADGNAFTNGRVALDWTGHWTYPGYSKAVGSDLVVLPLPNFGDGPKTGQGSWTWGITAGSRNAMAAGKFLDYLLNDQNVSAMTGANGAPPATKSVLAQSTLYKAGGALYLFAQQLALPCGSTSITSSCVAVTRPVTAGYPVVTTQFSSALNNIWNGADPMTALTKAAHLIDVDFQDNNNYQVSS